MEFTEILQKIEKKGCKCTPFENVETPKRFSDIKCFVFEGEFLRNATMNKFKEISDLIFKSFPNGFRLKIYYGWIDFPKCSKYGVTSIVFRNKNADCNK